MIPACRDEISTCPAEADFTPRLHVEIKFRVGRVGKKCLRIYENITTRKNFLPFLLMSTPV